MLVKNNHFKKTNNIINNPYKQYNKETLFFTKFQRELHNAKLNLYLMG